jgi:hypothetical protein
LLNTTRSEHISPPHTVVQVQSHFDAPTKVALNRSQRPKSYGLTPKSIRVNSYLLNVITPYSSRLFQGNRYACSLESCRTEVPGTSVQAVRYFSTWSELQRHIRDDHPPSCPRPECDGQTFASQKAFRVHLRVHEQDETLASGAEGNTPAKKARRGGEYGRDWACSKVDCDMAFKSVRRDLQRLDDSINLPFRRRKRHC